MKKIVLTILFVASAFMGINAQVENRALYFTPAGTVDCGAMPDFNDLNSYSLQFWMNPESWTSGVSILGRGTDFSVKLGEPGILVFSNDNNSISATIGELGPGEWNQVTLVCRNGDATVLVNGEEAGSGRLGATGSSDSSFYLGENYSGLLDEVRIWDDALNDEMQIFDYFINNTLNKWCPMWENLIAYYKMDQKDCPYLVDYKGIYDPVREYDNHGILNDGVSKVLANNEKMPYLINSAYTNNERFFDRTIPRDQYLLANDLIILGSDVYASDGRIETKTPNNHARMDGVDYLESFEGRTGVASFKGVDNSRLIAPSATLNNGDKYSFETWLYLEEWTPGAFLFRKETSDGTKGVSLRLGDNASEPRLVARVNGNDFVSQQMDIRLGEWYHVGIAPGSGGSVIKALLFFLNGNSIRPDVSLSTDQFDVTPTGNDDIDIFVGEKLKGKMDETAFWNKRLSLSDETKHQTDMPMPSITKNVNVIEITDCSAYYKYDNPDNLGYSSHSQDHWLNIMKGAYEGYEGARFYISVQGYYSPREPYGDWRNILANASKRERFVNDLVELSKNYDGVELDLEWIEQSSQWTNFGVLAKEIKEALPEDKIFRVSLHNSYTAFPLDKTDYVDGFTFQQYGPQAVHFGYNNFVNNVNNFIQKFDRNKIMTSYSTTTSNGTNGMDAMGVKGNCLNSYVPGDQNVDTYTINGGTYSYMGPMQVYKRAKYTREQNLQGIFYWDMGNDNWNGTPAAPEMPEYNLAKYCSYGINANCDTIVKNLNVNHYKDTGSVKVIPAADRASALIKVSPSIADSEISVFLSNGETPVEVLIYSVDAALKIRSNLSEKIYVGNLASGLYLLNVKDSQGKFYKTKFVKR